MRFILADRQYVVAVVERRGFGAASILAARAKLARFATGGGGEDGSAYRTVLEWHGKHRSDRATLLEWAQRVGAM